MEQPIEEAECKTITQYMLYKLDRTLAIVGLIVLGGFALWRGGTESLQIAIAVVGALAGYVGGRSK